MSVASVSVLIPTYQGGALFARTLEALRAQELELPWDVHAVDSGSTDGTLEALERAARDFPVPLRVRRIHQAEFDHGDTRNLLAAESAGELLVFLTQDAIPGGPSWLSTLVANFEDDAVGAAYCRNVARPEADLLTRVFTANDPSYHDGRREVRLPDAAAYAAMSPHEKRLLYNFNDVASAIRRDLWQRHPFPRTSFGEDVLMARALLEAGFKVVYDDRAAVEHSHDHDAEEMRGRAVTDGEFNARWLDRICVASRSDANALVRTQLATDKRALESSGAAPDEIARELARAESLRRAAFEGLYEGGRVEAREPTSRLLEDSRLHVLYVVHGFPPDTWAGTEVYALGLAREVQRLGHRVTVLTRRAPRGETPAPELQRVDFGDLEVWRMEREVEDQPLRRSFDHAESETVFAELLERTRPDVVHFQHLLHFSARLPHIAREAGVPSVLTCNDYWALCARVQLIRPDGVRCPENQGLGCLWCVKDRNLSRIGTAKRFAPALQVGFGALRALSHLPRVSEVEVDGRPVGRVVEDYEALTERQDKVLGGYAAADLQIAPSRFLREKHLATGRFDPRRLVYSDYGLETRGLERVTRRRDPDSPIRFAFIGSLVWYKGVEVLMEAMRHLQGTCATLAVHGDFRPEEDDYHAGLLSGLRADNVRFLGRFDNDRLPEVYEEVDVLVVPSLWYENSPVVIHEAFAADTPVVTSDIGGMAELVTDDVDGLHFHVGDAEDLARVLRRFTEDPDLAPRLAANTPRIKTLGENAREMEYRYRALVCRSRD